MPEEYKHLPLVGKCCAIDEVLIKDTHGNTVCAPSNDSSTYFSPLFSDFNHTGALVPGDKYETFTALVGNPCNQRYVYGNTKKKSAKIGTIESVEKVVTNRFTESHSLLNIGFLCKYFLQTYTKYANLYKYVNMHNVYK